MSEAPALRDKVLEVLRGHLSAINAMAVLRVAERATGIASAELRPSELPALVDAIRTRLPTFIANPSEVARSLTALATAARAEVFDGARARPEARDAAVDSARARPEARDAAVDSARARPEGREVPAPPSSRPKDVVRVDVTTEADIFTARALGRQVCMDLGFGAGDQVKVMTAISEVARNIVQYAKRGQIEFRRLTAPAPGIEVVARDSGPGIADVERVLDGRHGARAGKGMGLRSAKALMDEMQVRTAPGAGTTVTARKLVR